jgi:hypothetical protein
MTLSAGVLVRRLEPPRQLEGHQLAAADDQLPRSQTLARSSFPQEAPPVLAMTDPVPANRRTAATPSVWAP